METISGKIEKVDLSNGLSQKTGKPFTRWVFHINGKQYATFDEKIGTGFKAGQFVEMQGQQNGAYWNMETMRVIDAPADEPQTSNSNVIEDLLRQILAELKSLNNSLGLVLSPST